jgi:hypothetical protein
VRDAEPARDSKRATEKQRITIHLGWLGAICAT